MKNSFKLTLTAFLVLVGSHPAVADRCITQGDYLNASHSLYSESVDPYAHLLPRNLPPADNLSLTYDLNLKPYVVNDLTQLQFQTYDSRSPAAGYTSPYLWEVGQGPSYRGYSSPYYPGGPGFGPMPLPSRR